MIAALYVETNGAYWDLPGVDPWDETRDARQYDGPHPVVAHPPCQRWCIGLASLDTIAPSCAYVGAVLLRSSCCWEHPLVSSSGCFRIRCKGLIDWGV
jgi:hypothetical protein